MRENPYNPQLANHKPVLERTKQHVWHWVQVIGFRCSPFFARRWRLFLFRAFGGKVAKKTGGQVSLSRTCVIGNPWNVTIGAGSSVGEHVDLRGSTTLTIGENVCISPGVKVHGASHDISSSTFDYFARPVVIGDSVWIAEDAIILPGVTIGEGAVIGAGSVVTKDVQPWTVVAGNPARFVKQRHIANEGKNEKKN